MQFTVSQAKVPVPHSHNSEVDIVISHIHAVFTKNFSDHKPTGLVNHQNLQAQILFCWPEKN